MSAEAIQTLPAAPADPLSGLVQVSRDVGLTLARTTYTGAYFMAYAAVFTALLVGKAIPQQNPVIEGFRDGGRAARDLIDETRPKGHRR